MLCISRKISVRCIIGTLLDIDGKCKDGDKARLDMQHLEIRQD
jgi:hypothetical protein